MPGRTLGFLDSLTHPCDWSNSASALSSLAGTQHPPGSFCFPLTALASGSSFWVGAARAAWSSRWTQALACGAAICRGGQGGWGFQNHRLPSENGPPCKRRDPPQFRSCFCQPFTSLRNSAMRCLWVNPAVPSLSLLDGLSRVPCWRQHRGCTVTNPNHVLSPLPSAWL